MFDNTAVVVLMFLLDIRQSGRSAAVCKKELFYGRMTSMYSPVMGGYIAMWTYDGVSIYRKVYATDSKYGCDRLLYTHTWSRNGDLVCVVYN